MTSRICLMVAGAIFLLALTQLTCAAESPFNLRILKKSKPNYPTLKQLKASFGGGRKRGKRSGNFCKRVPALIERFEARIQAWQDRLEERCGVSTSWWCTRLKRIADRIISKSQKIIEWLKGRCPQTTTTIAPPPTTTTTTIPETTTTIVETTTTTEEITTTAPTTTAVTTTIPETTTSIPDPTSTVAVTTTTVS